MRNKLTGWRSVYGFTVGQTAKTAGFKLVTVLVTILILAAIVLIVTLDAKPDKEDIMKTSPIERVYVLDKSGLAPVDYQQAFSQSVGEEFIHIAFSYVTDMSREDVVKTAGNHSTEAVAVIISTNDDDYQLEAAIPYNSDIASREAEQLLGTMSSVLRSELLMQAGLSSDQLAAVLKPTVTAFSEIGEESSSTVEMIRMMIPMIFGFVLYFMLLLYSQTVSKSVSIEKTSKLIETLLTAVHPYALITGKVLAVTSLAVFQFVVWITAAFAGLYGGNILARFIYPGYENAAITFINLLRTSIGETALTLPAMLLAVLFFCVGFLFYCVLAAFAGCLVTKPEDVSSTQGLFTLPIIVSWLVAFIAPITGNEGMLTASYYIPFTAPFSVPANLMTGIMGLSEGIIALLLLTAFCAFFIILAARIYKGLVLYTGQKLSMKLIGNVLKNS